MKNLLRSLQFFRPDVARLLIVLVLMLISTAANLIKPWPLALIVDCVLGNNPFPRPFSSWFASWSKLDLLGLLALAIFLLHTLQGILSGAHNFLSIKIGLSGLARVRNEVFGRLLRLSFSLHHGTNSGDLIYRASWDTYAFQTLLQQGVVAFATAFLSLVLMVGIMLHLNTLLALIAFSTVPLLVLAIQFFGRRMSYRSMAAQKADSRITSFVQQSILALPLIQSYTREEFEARRFAIHSAEAQEKRLIQHGSELSYWFSITFVFGLGIAAITYTGASQVWAGALTVGELLVFLAYLTQLYEPLNQLSHVGSTVSFANAGTKRVFEILDTPEVVKEASEARRVLRPDGKAAMNPKQLEIRAVDEPASAARINPLMVRGAIEFDGVSFSYGDTNLVLRDVSFSLRAGEAVAIIGPSGAGKTTLLNLLPRFFDPAKGVIYLDGVDLRELRLIDLRAQIALVMQEPIILSASVAENIGYGRSHATQSEIEAAALAANADSFIRKLPQGYETQMGDGAAQLSVGEKQRINLARAFLKDSPLLILDEPTSALDAESETLVVASVHELMRRRTTLIVAHRFATIGQVDKILSLEEGSLTEYGSPSELRQRDGYYARVIRGQAKLA
jgi:ATP-binding cassette subfamily B protein/subfamily B ATP-binding cassette protein MsbA